MPISNFTLFMQNNQPDRFKLTSSPPPDIDGISLWGAKIQHYFKALLRYILNHRRLTMYILGRFQLTKKLAVLFFKPKTALSANTNTVISGVPIDLAVNTLRNNGYCDGLFLPPDVVQEIVNFAHAHDFFDNENTKKFFTYNELKNPQIRQEQQVLIGRYENTARDCPAITALQRDPTLIAIASQYFGQTPGHSDHRLWWSFAHNTEDQHARVRSGQAFHYDLDDYQTVSFFFYLTDVNTHTGPLMLIRGSHRKKKLQYLLSIFKARPMNDLLQFYGADNFIELCGPAGFGFAVDLFGYHRGKPPVTNDRLIVQIRFALRNYNQKGEKIDGFQGAAEQ
jgi:Phytanoyl-CoA dioxygenase (PhyH)